ncbi:MAG: T9SS type A sorting domain-containing protein, partial [Bacteroidota bacterium]
LAAVGRTLVISDNDALVSLAGLGDLATVAFTLTIASNAALASLDGLERLVSVVQNIDLRANAVLAEVDALQAVASIGNDLLVTGNPFLDDCARGLGPILSGEGLLGTTDIRDNATGCNSVDEILARYTSNEGSAPDRRTRFTAAYPSPASGSVTLAYTVARPAMAALDVFDALGRHVASLAQGPHRAGLHEHVWSGRALPDGVYIVRLRTDGAVRTTRVVLVR